MYFAFMFCNMQTWMAEGSASRDIVRWWCGWVGWCWSLRYQQACSWHVPNFWWAGSQWCLCMHVCLELINLALYHFKGLSGGLQPLPRPCEENCSGSILVFVILHFSRLDYGNHNLHMICCIPIVQPWLSKLLLDPTRCATPGPKSWLRSMLKLFGEVRAEHDSCGSLWNDFLWFLLPPALSFGFLTRSWMTNTCLDDCSGYMNMKGRWVCMNIFDSFCFCHLSGHGMGGFLLQCTFSANGSRGQEGVGCRSCVPLPGMKFFIFACLCVRKLSESDWHSSMRPTLRKM